MTQFNFDTAKQSVKDQQSVQNAIDDLPMPGSGLGFNPGVFTVALKASRSGLDQQEVINMFIQKLKTADVPACTYERDIYKQVSAGYACSDEYSVTPGQRLPEITCPEMVEELVERGRHFDYDALLIQSPVEIPSTPDDQREIFLRTMYNESDLIFVGNKFVSGKPFDRDLAAKIEAPLISTNPFSGQKGITADGTKESRRVDSEVINLRHVVIEWDSKPVALQTDQERLQQAQGGKVKWDIDDQISFLCALPLPIKALVWSGNDSVHAWIDVTKVVDSKSDWDQQIKLRLFGQYMKPMGCDPAMSNRGRLARLPGGLNEKSGSQAVLLYLDPNPTHDPICGCEVLFPAPLKYKVELPIRHSTDIVFEWTDAHDKALGMAIGMLIAACRKDDDLQFGQFYSTAEVEAAIRKTAIWSGQKLVPDWHLNGLMEQLFTLYRGKMEAEFGDSKFMIRLKQDKTIMLGSKQIRVDRRKDDVKGIPNMKGS